jgi:carbamoyltransferase
MTAILGISAFYHDSAAALIVDGEIVAAAQEERFTRKKHDAGFPKNAIDYCLSQAGLTAEQLDYVGFYDKPLLKFERLLETYVTYAPGGWRSFFQAMPVWLREKLWLRREMFRGLDKKYTKRFVYCEHHESHAASAFFPSPFDEAAILTIDGVGEWATTTFGVGRGNKIELTHQINFPHSLGLLYSAFTYFTGFRVNSGEYKLMGLAPYGEPKYKDVILEHLIDLKDDGSFRLNMDYFGYATGLRMTNSKFDSLFGGPPRQPESDLTQREMDIAASIQAVTEEAVLRMARHIRAETGQKNLVMAGGVALNCVANGKILSEGIFDDLWIQPASGDAGGALGVAQLIWYQLLKNERDTSSVQSTAANGTGKGAVDLQGGSFLGPDWSDELVQSFIESEGAVAETFDTTEALQDRLAELIETENVIGVARGRMEFGPRALGNRSIIGDARSPKMQSIMNLKIKFRESFRPFAPCVLQERVHDYFEMQEGQFSPYMLLVADVNATHRYDPPRPADAEMLKEVGASVVDAEAATNDQQRGMAKLHQLRSDVPAITHVDNSARVQTVDAGRHPFLHGVMKKFEARTGCPVIINTSFNIRGEPIVCSPADAYRCFMNTNMDALLLGNHLLLKEKQPNAKDYNFDEYIKQFKLD